MRILASHPEVAAHTEYPLEFRLFGHFAFPHDLVAARNVQSGRYRFPGDQDLLYGPISRSEKLALPQVKAIYAAIASDKKPKFFVEKFHQPLHVDQVKAITPNARFILLTRDPRDVFLSARSFNKKRGRPGFQERVGDTDEDVVLRYVDVFGRLVSSLGTANPVRVRYEDLAASPHETVTNLFRSLGLASTWQTVSTCIDRAAAMENGTHTTSESLSSSVYRWRREMAQELQGLFTRHLGFAFDRFGYPRA